MLTKSRTYLRLRECTKSTRENRRGAKEARREREALYYSRERRVGGEGEEGSEATLPWGFDEAHVRRACRVKLKPEREGEKKRVSEKRETKEKRKMGKEKREREGEEETHF